MADGQFGLEASFVIVCRIPNPDMRIVSMWLKRYHMWPLVAMFPLTFARAVLGAIIVATETMAAKLYVDSTKRGFYQFAKSRRGLHK